MKKLTKAKYPDKTSINLVMREDEQGNTKLLLAGFGLFLVALLIFVRFAVVGPISKASEAESNYHSIQSQIDEMNQSLADYEDVSEEYSRYSSNYLNEEEMLITDRGEVLNLLDSCVMNRADIQNVTITANTVDITLAETNLSTVSQVVAALQEDARTAYVTVSTASTNSSSASNSQLVTADIHIELATVVDDETEQNSSDEATTTEAGGDAS